MLFAVPLTAPDRDASQLPLRKSPRLAGGSTHFTRLVTAAANQQQLRARQVRTSAAFKLEVLQRYALWVPTEKKNGRRGENDWSAVSPPSSESEKKSKRPF